MSVFVDEKTCVGCGLCVPACPREAIKAYGIAMIDENSCSDCFGGMGCLDDIPRDRQKRSPEYRLNWRKACMAHCPVKAIQEG